MLNKSNKIIFVTASLTSGGSERVMSYISNYLVKKGYIVKIICLGKTTVFYEIDKNIEIVFASNITKNVFKKIFWFRKYILKESPDIVIPFMVSIYGFTILSLLKTRIKILSSERIDPKHTNLIKKLIRYIFLRYTTHLVVQTNEIKKYYSQKLQSITTVIPNPISLDFYENNSSELKENRIISVGRLFAQKNHEMLIDAFIKIAEKFPHYKLCIYGDGPLRGYLQTKIDNANMNNQIFLKGKSSNIKEELNKSTIFCMTSKYEGMSNAMLEAMCVGLPIITTNISGVEELIENEENGFIIQSVDELADKITLLINNQNLRDTMGNNNISKSMYYNPDKIMRMWNSVIDNVINTK